MPHGRHIYATAYDMDIATMCALMKSVCSARDLDRKFVILGDGSRKYSRTKDLG